MEVCKKKAMLVFGSIDKPGGISIDDIEPISRELSEKLDQEDFISDAYILEVSSPGLEDH